AFDCSFGEEVIKLPYLASFFLSIKWIKSSLSGLVFLLPEGFEPPAAPYAHDWIKKFRSMMATKARLTQQVVGIHADATSAFPPHIARGSPADSYALLTPRLFSSDLLAL
ncbi:MAG: hypothetical protein JW910_10595, partial [Anaerolineae bacterium]|nr:hypothetical protein [Anaerolineae bacterium]